MQPPCKAKSMHSYIIVACKSNLRAKQPIVASKCNLRAKQPMHSYIIVACVHSYIELDRIAKMVSLSSRLSSNVSQVSVIRTRSSSKVTKHHSFIFKPKRWVHIFASFKIGVVVLILNVLVLSSKHWSYTISRIWTVTSTLPSLLAMIGVEEHSWAKLGRFEPKQVCG